MADAEFKKLLVKLGIDTSTWKSAVKEIQGNLQQLADQEKQRQAQQKAVVDQLKQQAQEQLQAQLKVKAEVAAQVEQHKAVLRTQKEVTAAARAQAAQIAAGAAQVKVELQKQVLESRQAQEVDRQRLTTMNLQTAQIRAQNAALQQQITALRLARTQQAATGGGGGGFFGLGSKGGRAGEGGGFLGGLLGGFSSKLAGTIGFAVLSAEGLGRILEDLTKHVVELVKDSSNLEHLQDTFERLGKIKGVDTVKFLNDLRNATLNMVGDTDLLRIANTALQSGLNATSGDVTKLVHNVTALAISQGRTAKEATEALTTAFTRNRFAILAHITGLNTLELQFQKFGAVIPRSIQQQEQFNQLLDATSRKLLMVGEPTLTLTDRLTILRTEWERTQEAFAIDLVKSSGFRSLLVALDDLINKFKDSEEAGKGLAAFLSPIFEVLAESGKTIAAVFSQLKPVLTGVLSQFNDVVLGFKSGRDATFLIGEAFVALGESVTYVAEDLSFLTREFLSFVDVRKGVMTTIDEMRKEYKDWEDQLKSTQTTFTGLMKDMEDKRIHPPVEPPKKKTVDDLSKVVEPAAQDPAYEVKMAKLNEELKQALNKEALENTKANLEAEKDANEEAYHSMAESFQQYIETKKKLREEDLKATLLELKQDRDAKLQEASFEEQLANIDIRKQLAEAHGAGGTTSEEKAANAERVKSLQDEVSLTSAAYEIRKKMYNAQYEAAASRANAAAGRDITGLNDQLVKDALDAARKQAEGERQVLKDSIDEQKAMLEDKFKEGLISADDYLDKRKAQIAAERDIAIQAAQDEFQHTQDTLVAEQELRDQEGKAWADYYKAITKVDLSEDDIRIKAMEQNYDRVAKILQGQASLAATPTGRTMVGDTQIDSLQQLMKLNTAYIEQLRQEASHLDKQSASYQDIVGKIVKAEEEQEKYNVEIAKAKDLLTPAAGFFGALGSIFSGFQRSSTKQIGVGLQAGASSMAEIGQWNTGMGAQLGGKSPFSAVISTGKQAFNAMHDEGNIVTTTLSTVDDGFKRLISTLAAVTTTFQKMGPGGQIPSGTTTTTQTTPTGQAIGQNATGGVPHFAEGGPVTSTGLAMVHSGEYVLPPDMLSMMTSLAGNLNDAFTRLLQSVNSVATTMLKVSSGGGGGVIPPGTTTSIQTTNTGNVIGGPVSDFLTAVGATPSSGPSAKDYQGFTGFLEKLGGQGPGSATSSLQGFISTLEGAAKAVGGFLQATMGAQTTTSGAIGGALSGASLGAAFGPIGAGIGAAVGGIFGGIEGSKHEAQAEFLAIMKQSFNSVVEQVNTGLIGSTQAITQLYSLFQQTGGAYGEIHGSDATKQTLSGMAQTLQQMQIQQQQTIQAMQVALDQVSEPTAYQQWMSNLEQIVGQYKQFAQAASDTQQLAQAQQYLTQALQNYATTQATQVQSSEIDAINNALQLNQLYVQRQQLMEQYAQQQQGIMAGGVQVREASASATKAAQLAQLDVQYKQQMDQLNQQIAVSQYQYTTQQGIFNLATTQAGLEMQVISLKDNQIDQQNASIAAQENLINMIKSVPAAQLATMPQIYAALGIPYTGPSASQVGPQVGPLTNQPTNLDLGGQYPVYPTYPTNPSTPPWVYTGSTGGTQGSGASYVPNGSVVMSSGGAMPTSAANTDNTSLSNLLAEGQSVVPSQMSITAVSPSDYTTPIYYLQSPDGSTLTPVYNQPGFTTAANQPATVPSTYPTGFNSVVPSGGTIASLASTSGIGSSSPSTTTLQNALMYPGLTQQASTPISGYGAAGAPTAYQTAAYQPTSPLAPIIGQQPGISTYAPSAALGNTFIGSGPSTAGTSGAFGTSEGLGTPATEVNNTNYHPQHVTYTTEGLNTSWKINHLNQAANQIDAIIDQFNSGALDTSDTAAAVQAFISQWNQLYSTSATSMPMFAEDLLGIINQAQGIYQSLGSSEAALPGEPAGLLPVSQSPILFNPGPTPNPTPAGPLTGGGGQNVISVGSTSPFGLPQAQGGADLTSDTVVQAHAGELILPPDISTGLKAMIATNANQAQSQLLNSKVSTEQQVSDIATQRIQAEMQLLSAKTTQSQIDAQNLAALQQILSSVANGNLTGISALLGRNNPAPGQHFETNLWNVYQQRGRYGEGGFAGEYP